MAAAEESGGAPRVRRRTFLIDRQFQLKWTAIIVLVGVLISAALGYFIVRLSLENTELLAIDAEMRDIVAQADARSIYYLIGFVVVMALALFFWGIFMTHRVAGPIFIISRYLRQIADGEVPRTRPLRRGDELQEFFETFSAMVSAMRQRQLDEAALLQRAAAALKTAGGEGSALASELEKMAVVKQTWDSAAS